MFQNDFKASLVRFFILCLKNFGRDLSSSIAERFEGVPRCWEILVEENESHVMFRLPALAPVTMNQLVELTWSWMLILFPRPVRTSELCALERRDTDTRDLPSIVSSHSSCARVVTSPDKTEPEVRASTVRSSPMRTSAWSTPDQESCPWPTVDQTPTDHSSSSAQQRPDGWTASTLCLAELLTRTRWPLSRRSSPTDPRVVRPARRSLFKLVVNCKNCVVWIQPQPTIPYS